VERASDNRRHQQRTAGEQRAQATTAGSGRTHSAAGGSGGSGRHIHPHVYPSAPPLLYCIVADQGERRVLPSSAAVVPFSLSSGLWRRIVGNLRSKVPSRRRFLRQLRRRSKRRVGQTYTADLGVTCVTIGHEQIFRCWIELNSFLCIENLPQILGLPFEAPFLIDCTCHSHICQYSVSVCACLF
jgi:hypothetical protein